MAWQGGRVRHRVSCQVTVGVGVTGIDVSSRGSRNFNGDLTLGTLSRSLFSWRLAAMISGGFDQHRECVATYSSQQVSITMDLGQGVCHLLPFHQPTVRTSVVWISLPE